LLGRGFPVACVELGPALAEQARNLHGPVEVHVEPRADPRVRRHWCAILHVARRREIKR
jgi:hypothetical protein